MSITVIDNFLPEELYIQCNEYSIDILENRSNNIFFTNYTWEEGVRSDSAVVLIHETHDIDITNKISNVVKEKFGRQINRVMFYYWMQCSHIPWHNDKGHNGGITIYLNEKWNKNHGGIFLFDDGKHILGIYPHKNRAIENFGNVEHSVCPTTINSNIRRTIQIFF
jgi:hypothetical protein